MSTGPRDRAISRLQMRADAYAGLACVVGECGGIDRCERDAAADAEEHAEQLEPAALRSAPQG
eukprot:6175158-Pleurochrysis_carterae.AAC.1